MAVMVTTATMAARIAFFLFIQCILESSADVQYQIPRSDPDESSMVISFHPHHRFRRLSDSGANSTAGTGNAESSTHSGTTVYASPEHSSQTATRDPASSSTNGNTSLATSASPAVTSPTHSVTTQQAQSTERFNNESTSPMHNPFEEADVVHDYYNYYTSDIIKNKLADHWVEVEKPSRHETLSSGHRLAAVIDLKFDFYFYGHKVTNVTVATGGFIYMSPFLHQWLTATQYIAPLMANFDPSMSTNSSIFYKSETTRFIVEWHNIMLKDQTSKKTFHFQTILGIDSSIKFVYKSVPIPIAQISTEEHPVKVGVSDAYYNDTFIPRYNMKKRTIYEYHKVSLNMSLVTSGAVIILTPLPTCNRLLDCVTCVQHVGITFDCRWCNTIGRCSDGLDWYRQHWDREGCQIVQTKDANECSTLPPPSRPITDHLQTTSVKAKCQGDKCDKKDTFPVGVVVILLLLICGLLVAIGGWVLYAYKNPTSKSGMWLLEHRPSQMRSRIKFWKSSSDSGTKYKVESET